MTKEEFVTLIEDHKRQSERLESLMEVLNDTNIFETGLFDFEEKLFDTILELSLESWAKDTVDWWIYEKEYGTRNDLWIEDENNKKIYLETVDDLWDYIKDGIKP